MKEVKQWAREKVKEMAKNAVRNSVGKSYLPFGHDLEIPKEVEEWVVENNNEKIK